MAGQQTKTTLAMTGNLVGRDDRPLTFGIYPGGPTGNEAGLALGAPDSPDLVERALFELQPAGRPFVVRAYQIYAGNGRVETETPADFVHYIHDGRILNLVLCFHDAAGDVARWQSFVRETVRRFGPHLGMLQIAEEANSTGPGGDGPYPNVREAIVAGVLAAKDEANQCGFRLQVGFNATPSFSTADDFWHGTAALVTPAVLDALDYVALDFFPDVFRPLPGDGPQSTLAQAVAGVLQGFRKTGLALAHIPPTVPMHIGENGWPTSPTRPCERQAAVLDTVVRTIYASRIELNITHYVYFDLRDAVSANPDIFFQFGLMRDNYTPKPAFHAYRALIAELGAAV
jgi:hypothetical protein